MGAESLQAISLPELDEIFLPHNKAPRAMPNTSPIILAVGRLGNGAKNLVLLDNVTSRLSWPIFVASEECHRLPWPRSAF
jgi:hypothetical protein